MEQQHTEEKSQEFKSLLNSKPHWMIHRSGIIGLLVLSLFIVCFALIPSNTTIKVRGNLMTEFYKYKTKNILHVQKHSLDGIPEKVNISIEQQGKRNDFVACMLKNPSGDHERYEISGLNPESVKKMQKLSFAFMIKKKITISYEQSLLLEILY